MVGKESTRPVPGILNKPRGRQWKAVSTAWIFSFAPEVLRILPAILSPLLTAIAEQWLWQFIRPFAWFLFYPAVILSAWIGGLSGGIIATLLSTVLAWWWCIPPEYTFSKDDPRYFLPAAVFFCVSLTISFFQGRLKKQTRQIANALNEAREAGKRLQGAHDAITRLFEHASDGIFIADLSGRVVNVNAAACRMLGYSETQRHEVVGQSFEAYIAAENIERLWQAKARLLAGKTQIEEWSLRRKDGGELPVEISANIFPDGRWQIFARDISDRKASERRLKQIGRANRALSKCNQVLVRAADEGALLKQVCDLIVEDAGYPFCWVGQAMHDETKSVKVVAQSGHDSDYVDALGITWADEEHGRGPTGTCIRTRQTVTARDIASAPEMSPWRAKATMRGYGSSLAIPLILRDETFGALSIYALEADAFREDEVVLLTELAEDLSYGISALRTKAEQTRAEEELRTLNAELEQRVLARTWELQQAREHEFEIGCRIQQSLLLDSLPAHIPGVSIAALALPTQRIDGDFVVFTEPRGRAFDVMVGDVMGKGVPAALLGAATKAHLLKSLGQLSASIAPDELPKPEDVVMRTHAEIVRQLIQLESFVTLCYVRVDPLRSIAQLVDCGRTGMIQLHAKTGKTDLLRGDNLPLGIRQDEIYKQAAFALEAGDLLFLFSDGITDARDSSGEVFGSERLQQCIEAQRHLEPAALVESIRLAVVSFCGSDHLADDVTIVALRVEETGPPIAKAVKTISSGLCHLHEARKFTRTFCERLPGGLLGRDSVDALELAVNEATSNIMKHAYGGRSDRWIHIEAEAFPGRVAIRLRHQGIPFSPQPPSPPSVDTLRESGFGLFMLSQCVDNVQYYQDERGGNSICLTKRTDQKIRNEEVMPWRSRSKTRKA
jgi:sigma-B regulation protein RsbU (phosphoserine phosphatase)